MAVRHLFVIDPRVEGYAAVLAQLPADAVAVVLDPGRDGLSQILESLQGLSGLASVRVLSHGEPGALLLGAGRVDQAALDASAGLLAAIGSHLGAEADLLLYGCAVAAGEAGAAFVSRLAALTGADVAASDDATGSPLLGGDWILEDQTGPITAQPLSINGFTGLLAVGNQKPTFTNEPFVTLPENTQFVTTMDASDPDGDPLSFSIVNTTDSPDFGLFTVNASTGVLQFLIAPDYESPQDFGSDNTYNVALMVDDGTLTDVIQLAITITGSNEAPEITSDGAGNIALLSVAEGITGAVTDVNATDSDLPPQSLTYSIVGGADSTFFTIDSSTGVLRFLSAPDYELPMDSGGDNVYDVSVQVSDGTLNDLQGLQVSVVNVSEAPVITSNGGGTEASLDFAENSGAVVVDVNATDSDLPPDTLTFAIAGGSDSARFTLNASTGELRFISAPDFEAPVDDGGDNVYDVRIEVSDGTLTDSQALRITITNVNEAPLIISNGGAASADLSFSENGAGVVTDVNATDVDAPPQTLTYTIAGGDDADRFSINLATGELRFIVPPNYEAPTDTGANNVYEVSVRVSDGSLTDTQALRIAVTNVNDAPVISSNGGGAAASLGFSENGTGIVTDVNASDADLPPQSLTYAISGGTDSALFTINSSTGVLNFISAPDYENPDDSNVDNVYEVNVSVSDGTLSDLQTLRISVTNVNEAPFVVNPIPDQFADEDLPFSYTFAASRFGDVDAGDTLTFDATRPDGSALPGWLTFAPGTRTFSGTPSNADIGDLQVRVIATDSGGLSTVDVFTITVRNQNDAPYILRPIPDTKATEDTPFSFQFAADTFSDIDPGDISLLTYSASSTGGGALPSWLVFDPATRTFWGTPTNSDVGIQSVTVTASDGRGGSVNEIFEIDVANIVPVVANPLIDQAATEGLAFRYTFGEFDFADGDIVNTLAYSASLLEGGPLPAWLRFDTEGRTFSGTPTPGSAGTIKVKVNAADGNEGVVSDVFEILVRAVNNAPYVASPIPDAKATEDTPFSFQFGAGSFGDANSDPLVYTAFQSGTAALPSWLSFDPTSRTFSGTPTNAEVGTVSISVQASDGTGTPALDTFEIAIANVVPTVASPVPDRVTSTGTPFSYTFPDSTFVDGAISNTLTYSASLETGAGLPSWLVFDAAARTFSGTPGTGDAGTLRIRLTAADGKGGIVSDLFDIIVNATNDAPYIANPIPDAKATEDTAFSFQFSGGAFGDANGDPLTFSVGLAGGASLPSWLTFNAANRTFSGTPTNAEVGTISVSVAASDGKTTAAVDTFDIEVANVVPVVSTPIADQAAAEDSPFRFTFPANTFADGSIVNLLNYSARLVDGQALPAWLLFDPLARTFSGTPGNGDAGTLQIVLTANDGNQGFVSDYFDLVVANVNDQPSGNVTIRGQARQGEVLFADLTGLTDPDGLPPTSAFNYEWLADGQPILDAHGASFVLGQDQVGAVISVRVAYTDLKGSSEIVNSPVSARVVNVNDSPTGSVTIAGVPIQGGTLSVNQNLADLDGLGPLQFQWYANGTALSGQTGSTLNLDQNHVGRTIQVSVRYTDGFGFDESVTSAGSAPVANIDDEATGTLTVTGSSAEGGVLLASISDVIDPDGSTYVTWRWQGLVGDAWFDIGGATDSLLDIPSTQAWVGRSVRAVATTHDTRGGSTDIFSDSFLISNINDPATGEVVIMGLAQEGVRLLVDNSLIDLDGLGPISYQWRSNGIDIPGAVGGSYQIRSIDVGSRISVLASFVDGGGTLETKSSFETVIVGASDQMAPKLLSVSPPDESTVLDNQVNIVLNFSENVQRGSGTIMLMSAAGNLVEAFDVGSSSALTFSGSTVTVDPSLPLMFSQGYRMEVPSGAIRDLEGNAYAGLTGYNFATSGYDILGTEGSDNLIGLPSADRIRALGGNDAIRGGGGNDTIDGGSGIDKAFLAGERGNYRIGQIQDGAWSVVDDVGFDGADRLFGIERLHFADIQVALDMQTTQHGGRTAEFIGVLASNLIQHRGVFGAVLGVMDGGRSLLETFQLAIDIGLVRSLSGTGSNDDVARLAFRNVVGSEASVEMIDFLTSYMDGRNASLTQAQFLTTVAQLEVNHAHINLVGLQQTGVEYL